MKRVSAFFVVQLGIFSEWRVKIKEYFRGESIPERGGGEVKEAGRDDPPGDEEGIDPDPILNGLH